MECEEFLTGFSEFLDGRLEPSRLASFDAHLEACRTCRRYDEVVRRALQIWRGLPNVESSPDFLPRLRHRLYHIDDATRLSQPALGSAALVAVAAVGMLALAWLPFATRASVEVELPAVAVEAPTAHPSSSSQAEPLFRSGPFVTPSLDYWNAASPRPAVRRHDFFGSPPANPQARSLPVAATPAH